VCALLILHDLTFRDYSRITLILNSNEETGSWGTRDLIRQNARQSDVAINLERGASPDAVLVSRKGSAVITLEISGRAAHPGLEPEKGRNAIVEAAHQEDVDASGSARYSAPPGRQRWCKRRHSQ
jgi:glutamate carboxypeptidase